MIKISLTENDEMEEWDEYVNAHPDSCVFQTSAWRRVVESTYGHKPFYLMAKRGSEVCGVLPLFLINSRLFSRVLATSPYGSSGGICADDEEVAHLLAEKAIQLTREHEVSYLELKSRGITEYDGLQRHTDYVNYYLPIDKPEIMWRSRLKNRTRETVRQAEKFGLTKEQGHHLLDVFCEIMATSMRRLGSPFHSKSLFHNILVIFGSYANILVVKYKDIPISAVIFIQHRQEVVPLWQGSLEDYFHMRPNNFLYWEMFKDAYSSGATSLDFSRSLVGSGPAKFKESWGAVAKPLYYEYFLNGQKSIPRIHQENPRYQIPRLIWKHMPLSLTKWLGPYLIKNIP
jgi:FemAB-related protein (PEP-CTERM system-associated)